MSIISNLIGIAALIFLSMADSALPSQLGWTIVALLMVDFSASSALRKDVRENGINHSTPVTKSWIVIGLFAELLITALSLYVFFNLW